MKTLNESEVHDVVHATVSTKLTGLIAILLPQWIDKLFVSIGL